MASPSARFLGLSLLVCLALVVPASAQAAGADEEFEPIRYGAPDDLDYMAPFFPGASYDGSIPTPDEILGVRHASRLSHHAEILACFERWAEVSPRVDLKRFGTTFEGRPLVRAVITSPANLARLDEIKADLARLAHADGLSDAGGRELLARTPPVAWMAYSIHGDELSGSDAAVALGYHLVASTDEAVVQLLDDVVVVIDPCQNPDGRERIIAMTEQGTGYVANLDYASMARGRWPWGRGNHYLFDMNRDWITGVLPETRARWAEARSFHPQLLIDAHEMGDLDTYLFYPQNQPHNPWLPTSLDRWQEAFAAD
ncbi:MAG: M14 family zinc carboxypeptidase, partial [Planctomycetota bacterium]